MSSTGPKATGDGLLADSGVLRPEDELEDEAGDGTFSVSKDIGRKHEGVGG